MSNNQHNNTPFGVEISEDELLQRYPDAFSVLLADQTMGAEGHPRNIFWATDGYRHLGEGYGYDSPILPELITGQNRRVITPRVFKTRDTQRDRVRDMAEVFTPSWICNAQNNLVDNAWFGEENVFNRENDDHTWTPNPHKITFPAGKSWQDYILDTRLEITCGEAPYLASRYDTTTGKAIPLGNRIGLLDRKLRVVAENTDTEEEWFEWAKKSFQSVYGYEWQGDNLLIARENLFATFSDYHFEKIGCGPDPDETLSIALVISWNLWQMDGLKGVIPNSCKDEPVELTGDLFQSDERRMMPCPGCTSGKMSEHNGTKCVIKDWTNDKPIDIIFANLVENERK